ncbi:DUF2851 family protein [Membranihabitans maritimus]|uniref:DUF2851 family protein n=1 Tax=Membranihabitans maritimus TaxID=2904244 RepID=UPI001F4548DF|nr:DUF2851 family protein [Membranihabitans maritimus]
MKDYSPLIKEDFLQYIWRTQKFDKGELRTTQGNFVEVMKSGILNRDQGPDFIDSRVRIGGQLWAGKVEIHTKSSDWKIHGHDDNPDYFNVILHVVYEDDQPVKDQYGDLIATIELKDRIDHSILETYKYLNSYDFDAIPCENLLDKVARLNITSWKERMAVSRLEDKYNTINDIFVFSKKNLHETLFKLICRTFGFAKNGTAFEWMANTLNYKILSKHIGNRHQIESLLFGQAGMLQQDWKDDYPKALKEEYEFLAEKYELSPIDPTVWNFARMRPQNFPTIRISQLADFFFKYGRKLMYTLDWTGITADLDCTAHKYWDNHFKFDSESDQDRSKSLGKRSTDLIQINVLAPFMFFMGVNKNNQDLKDQALDILQKTDPESNGIMRKWSKLGVTIDHALDSQALLFLYKDYCMNRKCAQCNIGQAILVKS